MTLTIPRPFDGHAHLRDGATLRAVLPYTARQFGRAIAMPNLIPPVTTTALAKAYRDEIRAVSCTLKRGFEPFMALYLTDNTDPQDLEWGFREGVLTVAKLYPAGATTNSASGVTAINKIYPVLERLERLGKPLSIHGEVNDPDVDIFDREAVFIDRVLIPLRRDFPALRIVFEHLSCREAVDYVNAESARGNLAATITAHHLRVSRDDLLLGGLHPHLYCMPIVKKDSDRQALIKAATSRNPAFFAGTDSAPHPRTAKEGAQGASGCFTHVNAVGLYAQVFEGANALENIASFVSRHGPAFYGLPPETAEITLERMSEPLNDLKPILTGDGAEIVPFRDNAQVMWRVVHAN
jgi:dihydroorotase